MKKKRLPRIVLAHFFHLSEVSERDEPTNNREMFRLVCGALELNGLHQKSLDGYISKS